jgi:hypothetical protein
VYTSSASSFVRDCVQIGCAKPPAAATPL